MVFFRKLQNSRILSWLLALVVSLSFLGVPVFSVYLWQELSSDIRQSQELTERTRIALEMLSTIDQLGIGNDALVRMARDALMAREDLFMDPMLQQGLSDSAEAVNLRLLSLRSRMTGLSGPGWEGYGESIVNRTALLEADMRLLMDHAGKSVRSYLEDFAKAYIDAGDRFREMDSLAEEYRSGLESALQEMIHGGGPVTSAGLTAVLDAKRTENLLDRLQQARTLPYLDTSFMDLFSRHDTGTAGMGVYGFIGKLQRLMDDRMAPFTREWAGNRGRLEIRLAELQWQLDHSQENIGRNLALLASEIRKVLDRDLQGLTTSRKKVQEGLSMNGGMVIAVSLLLVILVVWTFWRIVVSNRQLGRQVEEHTRDLAMANQSLKDRLAELQATQQELVRSEKIAALAGLVAGVAHEMNTPLGVALTAASFEEEKIRELIAQQKEAGREPLALHRLREANEMVLRNLGRTAGLVQSFRQISADHTLDEKRKFFLDEYIGDLVQGLGSQFQARKVNVEREIEKNLLLQTYPGALAQTVSNLLRNVMDHAYGETGGSVRIQAVRDGDLAEILVADTGKGIDSEMKERIFEPFRTTDRPGGHSGLGLFVAHNLVHARMGGTISMSSGEEGTTVCVRIPLEAPSQD